ncbi:MAG: efflux RND transporter periplasmic adaptor subunit, partial [Thermodesulfobacteriota bacterium]
MNCLIKEHLKLREIAISLLALTVFQSHFALAQGRPPAKVVVSQVVKEHVQDRVTLIGTVEPWRTSRVAAEVSGKVDAFKVRRGDRVNKGDVLARLEKADLKFGLEAANARKNATGIRLEKAGDIFERSEKLIRQEAISAQEYREDRLTVQELREDLAAIEAEILRLEDELKKKTVRAPFDGVITRELTEVGQWVQKGGDIVHIVDLSMMRIIVDMPEQYVSNIKGNEEVTVRIDA